MNIAATTANVQVSPHHQAPRIELLAVALDEQGRGQRSESCTAADDADRCAATVQLVDDELDEQHGKHRERQLRHRLHDEPPHQRWPIADREPALAHAAGLIVATVVDGLRRHRCHPGHGCSHRHERDRVDDDDRVQAAKSDCDPTQGRSHQPRDRFTRRERGVGGNELLVGDDPRHQRERCGVVDLLQNRLCGGDEEHDPDPIPRCRQQRQQRQRLQDVGGDDRAPQVPTIGQRSPIGTQGHIDHELDQEHRGGVATGTSHGEHVDRQRQRQHPVAGVVDRRAHEHTPKVRVPPDRRSRRLVHRTSVASQFTPPTRLSPRPGTNSVTVWCSLAAVFLR